jgi:diguanylate cyclase (GGDEF)-like protein
VNQPATEEPVRPKVLLVGDASARPTGLERVLTQAGFQLVEEEPGTAPQADAILITLSGIAEGALPHLLDEAARNGELPPRIVLLASNDPDGPAAALALGAVDALAAPVHLPELCARLLLRIREHRASGSRPMPFEEATPVPQPSATAPPTPTGASREGILEHRVKEEFERARRYSLSFSLILLGIDDLSNSEGQTESEAATRLRTEVARTLRRELRAPDLVVPFAPDEFAIVLPETGEAGARQSVSRLRDRLTSLPFDGDPRLEPTRFSAGIVTYPHPAAQQTEDLFAMAEAALMRGKAQAGERIGIAM